MSVLGGGGGGGGGVLDYITVKIKVLFQPGYRSTQLQLSMISIAHSHDTRYIELSSTSRHSISPSNHPLY